MKSPEPQSAVKYNENARAKPPGLTKLRKIQLNQGRTGRNREEQGGTGRHREEQGGTGRNREELGGTGRNTEEQGGTGTQAALSSTNPFFPCSPRPVRSWGLLGSPGISWGLLGRPDNQNTRLSFRKRPPWGGVGWGGVGHWGGGV